MKPLVIVMGVSGCGKSTVAAVLAGRLRVPFRDADDFHPVANIAKMKAGHPLEDADRWPWLEAIAAWLRAQQGKGEGGVVACSALKRAYRTVLIPTDSAARLVFLKGSKALIAGRLAARLGHFMPPALLDSQFAALEEPEHGERPIVLDIGQPPEALVDAVETALAIPR